MYLMYVDESGDKGLINSPTSHYVLSGLIIHELKWKEFLTNLVEFRKGIRNKTSLKLREEIHAVKFINSPGDLKRIKRHNRLDILKQSLSWLSQCPYANVITIVVNKEGKTEDIFELAWKGLIQRFENTISHHNFTGPQNSDEKGMVFSDKTDDKYLTKIIRKMRRYNPIPSLYGPEAYRDIPISYVIEDPIMRHSDHSLVIQLVDVIAYFAFQVYQPNSYVKRKSARTFYSRLDPVLVKAVSRRHPLGIVEL